MEPGDPPQDAPSTRYEPGHLMRRSAGNNGELDGRAGVTLKCEKEERQKLQTMQPAGEKGRGQHVLPLEKGRGKGAVH